MMQERRWLESQGQLARKEFMLNDRYNWPTINIPGQAPAQGNYAHGQATNAAAAAAAAAAATGANNMHMGMMGRHGQFYPSNQTAQLGPSPAKRQRQGMGQPMLGGGSAVQGVPAGMPLSQESLLEEEENTALGDLLDNLTQEEISKVRYVQHHVWMEEVLSSPYAMNAIVPADLGLGLVGELGRLTDGILEPPVSGRMEELSRSGQVSADQQQQSHRRLEKGQMEEFERRVGKFLEDGEKDLRRMKASHARRLADMRRTKAYTVAERRLSRLMGTRGDEEQSDRPASNGGDEEANARASSLLESEPDPDEVLKGLVNDIESSMGVVIKPRKDIVCIDKGGFIDDRESENVDTAMSENHQSTKQDTLPTSSEQLDGASDGANANMDTGIGVDVVTADNNNMDINPPGSVNLAPGNYALTASTSNPPSNVNPMSGDASPPQTNMASADRKENEGNANVEPSATADGEGDVDMLKDIGLDLNPSMPDLPDMSSVAATPGGSGPANRPGIAEKDSDEDWIKVDSANAGGKWAEQAQQQLRSIIAPSPSSFQSAEAATSIATPTPATNDSQTATTNISSGTDSTPQLAATAGGNLATATAPNISKPSSAPTTTAATATTTSIDNVAAIANPTTATNPSTVPTVSDPAVPASTELFNFDESIGNTSVEGLVDFSGTGDGTGLDLDLDNSAFGDAFHIGEAVAADAAGDGAGGVGIGGSTDGVSAIVNTADSVAPASAVGAAGAGNATVPSSMGAGDAERSTTTTTTQTTADQRDPPAPAPAPAAPSPAT